MQKQIYGNLEYNGKSYPFILLNRTIRIVQQALQYHNDFETEETVPFIRGVTFDNRDILFLNCKMYKSFFEIGFSIYGYLLSSNNVGEPCDFCFDRISFYSDAIDAFYSPQRAAITQIGDNDCIPTNWDGAMKISIKPFSQTDTIFHFRDAEVTFSIARYRNLKRGTSSIGSMNTALCMAFSEQKMPELVCQYYLNVLDFLCFVNYSKNITFEKISLSKKCGDKFKEIARAIIFTNASAYDKAPYNSITIDDLPAGKIDIIFSQIATLREHDRRIHLYFPNSAEDCKFIDHSRWLMTALCFEGLFAYTYPNYKSQENKNFKEIKEGILNVITLYGDQTNPTGKKKAYLNDCKRHMELYNGNLEEKFNYVFKNHRIELSDIISSIMSMHGSNEMVNWGRIYQEFRNKLAHGEIVPIGDNEVSIYRLLCPMIYILLLQSTTLSSTELQHIIKKLFAN